MTKRQMTRATLVGGVLGPPLFVLVFLLEGVTRPGYSPWRHFVSQLSLSDQGWEQVANFIVCGVLVFVFALRLRRSLRTGKGMTFVPLLWANFALGLVAAGLFATDPALGYPPGVPMPAPQTTHGTIHGLAGLVDFVSLAAACCVLARRFAGDPRWRGWAAYWILTGVLILACFIGSNVASVLDAAGDVPGAPTGLLQRIGVIFGWSWIARLAQRLLRDTRAMGA